MVFEKVQAILCDFLELDAQDVTPESSFDELGCDELDMIDLTMSLEDDFCTEITDEVLETFKTVADVVAYLEKVI
ncbi:MAG: acyl carrier protein [Clostridia bacterium]|nr:acyl carrier protein [Clostridia bacterium]